MFYDGEVAPEDPRAVVKRQAKDEGLWFVPATAAEAYLQQELRRLHAAVEGEPIRSAAIQKIKL